MTLGMDNAQTSHTPETINDKAQDGDDASVTPDAARIYKLCGWQSYVHQSSSSRHSAQREHFFQVHEFSLYLYVPLLLLSHSLSHSLTLSLSHSLTLSLSHALTLSRSHALTLSRSHALTLSRSHALTLSRSHSLTLSLSHSLTLSLSLSLSL